MDEGTVVTFYSYKGGVGRSFALANVAALLAGWGYRVLCVDWDLEAPGLWHYFKKWCDRPQRGLLEFLEDFADGGRPNWRSFMVPVHLPDREVPVQFITSGGLGENYNQRVQNLDWRALYSEHDLGAFFEAMRAEMKAEFDFILLDGRTGVTDFSGIITAQLPDILVFMFTANEQSLEGVIAVVERAMEIRNSLPYDNAGLLTLPVACRFESREEYQRAMEWWRIFAERLAPFYGRGFHPANAGVRLPPLP